MKKRIIGLIVAVCFVLAGCGSSKPNAELDKFADEIVMAITKEEWWAIKKL